MSHIATHDGKVTKVESGMVTVEMHVLSACSSCAAHEKCGFVDKADKIVEVETKDWESYHIDDQVIVSVDEGMGLLAVLLAYILPAVIIIASVVLLSSFTDSEALAALVPIALTAAYFLILYFAKGRLQRKFSFGITKKDTE